VKFEPTDFEGVSGRKVIVEMANTSKTVADDTQQIGLREAVESARRYMNTAYQGNLEDVQLEETDLSADDTEWLITLSYLREEPVAKGVFTAGLPLVPNKVRVYKTITVDARTGVGKSMKIREL